MSINEKEKNESGKTAQGSQSRMNKHVPAIIGFAIFGLIALFALLMNLSQS